MTSLCKVPWDNVVIWRWTNKIDVKIMKKESVLKIDSMMQVKHKEGRLSWQDVHEATHTDLDRCQSLIWFHNYL